MTPDRARDIITRRLHPGERLIWHDAPNPWRIASRHLIGLAFGIFFTFTAFSRVIADYKGTLDTLPIVSALFCAIGVGIVGWSLRKAANGWSTAYGLTNHRAVIAVGDRGSIENFSGEAFYNIRVRGESRGTLDFNYASDSEGAFAYKNGFYGIREPARVEALIRKTLLKTSAEAGAS